MLEHGIQNEQQLAHAGYESQLLRLTSRQQPLVEVPDDGVVATGHQSSHVQGSANPGASAPDGPLASQGAAVPVEGSHSHQGGDLPAVQCAQLRRGGRPPLAALWPLGERAGVRAPGGRTDNLRRCGNPLREGVHGRRPGETSRPAQELDYGLEKIQAVRGHGHGGPG